LALEAIKIIKDSEKQATDIVSKAIASGKEILKKSEIYSDGQYVKILQAAKEETNKLIENAKEEGRIKSEPIIQAGKIEIDNILNLEKERFERAVNMVVERIVKNNGNS